MPNPISEFPLLLLCGGKSSRMGAPKGLLPLKGAPWFQYHIQRFSQFGGERAVVVLGHDASRYLHHLNCEPDKTEQWLDRLGLKLAVVVNPHPEFGQFSSIQCGLQYLESNPYSAAYLLPVDMPSPSADVWQVLPKVLASSIKVCVPSYQKKGGHPVLLNRSFWKTLTSLSPELPGSRLDQQIGLLSQEEIGYVNVDDPSILRNVNTKDEFESIITGEL